MTIGKNVMQLKIKLIDHFICIGVCTLLCAFLVTDNMISVILSITSLVIIVPSVTYVLFRILVKRDYSILSLEECRSFRVGLYLLGSVLFINQEQYILAAVLCIISLLSFVSMIIEFVTRNN